MQQRIHVIGAGIIGLACATRLILEGHQVTLWDDKTPGSGSSAGNPGGISASSVLPAAAPGVLLKVPGWLFDPDGPLSIRPGYFPRLAPWLIRFVMRSGKARYQAGIRALWQITSQGADAWERLLGEVSQPQHLLRQGNLIVYRSVEQFKAESASWAMRAELGLSVSEVPGSELPGRVPELSKAYVCGREVSSNARLSDPFAVATILAAFVQARGRIRREAVRGLAFPALGGVELESTQSRERGDLVVLAAGAHSAKLARLARVRAPLQPERGYSITYAKSPLELRQPVFSPSEKIMASPTDAGLRLAGSAEFTGFHAPPNPRRAQSLERLGRAMFPELPPLEEATVWTGDRPSTPDGLPLLGRASSQPRLLCAFGHGHLGVTSAAVTSEAIAALVAGRPPAIDLAPYATNRFGSLV